MSNFLTQIRSLPFASAILPADAFVVDQDNITKQTSGAEIIALTQNSFPQSTFSGISSTKFAPNISVITTTGFSTLGDSGGGSYVSDALANAAVSSAYPAFCTQSADGRYWRLEGLAITVEQGGATGVAGHNDQPATQQTFAYAAAVGIEKVCFGQVAYELWMTPRTTAASTVAPDGMAIVITQGVDIEGCPTGTTLTLKNSVGGPYATTNQAVSGAPWYGGGIFVWPNGTGSGTLSRLTMRRITVAGAIPYTLSGTAPAGNTGPGQTGVNVTGKGFWAQNVSIGSIRVYDCEFWGFPGEVFYIGGGSTSYLFVDDLRVHDSPQSAWNAGNAKNFTVNALKAGNAYQAAEQLGGYGSRYSNTRYYGSYGCTINPTPIGGNTALPYNYPTRQSSTSAPPWCEMTNVVFEQITQVLIGSYVRGNVETTDASLYIYAYPYNCNTSDVSLKVVAWVDYNTDVPAVVLGGPPTLTAPIAGGSYGNYLPAANINLDITCKRTDIAEANGRVGDGIYYSGQIDANSVQVKVQGEVRYAWSLSGFPSGAPIPLTTLGPIKAISQPLGGSFVSPVPATPLAVSVAYGAYVVYPTAVGTGSINLVSSSTYQDGQLVTFYHGGPGTTRLVSFLADSAGLNLARTYTLYQQGDWIRLRYDAIAAKWGVDGYFSGNTATAPLGAAAASDVLAGTSTALAITPAAEAGAQAEQTLVYAATVTPALTTGVNFNLTLTGNVTLANPTGALSGSSGELRIIQDATGSRVITYGTKWKFPGGAATSGVLSTAANAIDRLQYTIGADGNFYCQLLKAFS